MEILQFSRKPLPSSRAITPHTMHRRRRLSSAVCLTRAVRCVSVSRVFPERVNRHSSRLSAVWSHHCATAWLCWLLTPARSVAEALSLVTRLVWRASLQIPTFLFALRPRQAHWEVLPARHARLLFYARRLAMTLSSSKP